ncbi:MAG: substrate-binding domain-containing protein [Actinobacteria bacterium]|nr:substrate-binding domain-containing protein [Actinomycetota bacterium]
MKKTLFLSLSVILIVSTVAVFALAGCKQAAATETTAAVTTAAETTAAETTAAETTAAKVDYKLAFYMPAPHPWFEAVQTGIAAFTKDTGIEVYVQYGTGWKQEEENQLVEGLVAQGYNGIAVCPVDANGVNGLMEQMKAKGVKIAAHSTPPTTPTPTPFTVTTDVKAAAKLACEAIIKAMGEKGNILNVLEFVEDPNTILRKEGIEEVVATYPDVKIIQEIAGLSSQEESVDKISNAIAALGNKLNGMITTGYVPSVAASMVLTQLKNDATKGIIYVGIDDDPVVLKAISDGYIYGTFAQNPYGVGYISAMLLKLQLDGYIPKQEYTFINSWGGIVTKDNVGTYKDDVIKITNDILSTIQDNFNPPS